MVQSYREKFKKPRDFLASIYHTGQLSNLKVHIYFRGLNSFPTNIFRPLPIFGTYQFLIRKTPAMCEAYRGFRMLGYAIKQASGVILKVFSVEEQLLARTT